MNGSIYNQYISIYNQCDFILWKGLDFAVSAIYLNPQEHKGAKDTPDKKV